MPIETPGKALPAEPPCSTEGAPAAAEPVPFPPAENAPPPVVNAKILRFAKSERALHWSIAGPFLLSFTTAAILVFVYNTDRSRPYRGVFAGLHRASGIALAVLPMLATLRSRGDARIHLYNIRQAWTWVFDDIKWLSLMMAAAVSERVRLPEQGKFNAAEKLNFMVLMVTYPLYVLTGVLLWVTHVAVLSWLLHFFMAMLSATGGGTGSITKGRSGWRGRRTRRAGDRA
jgi:cytochrome b subunit of formate dehydrogenase